MNINNNNDNVKKKTLHRWIETYFNGEMKIFTTQNQGLGFNGNQFTVIFEENWMEGEKGREEDGLLRETELLNPSGL